MNDLELSASKMSINDNKIRLSPIKLSLNIESLYFDTLFLPNIQELF